jgi:hypothetical protein
MSLKKSKKGIFLPSDWVELGIVVVAMVVVLAAIFLLMNLGYGKTTMNFKESMYINYLTKQDLLTYVQLSTTYLNNQISVADLISENTEDIYFDKIPIMQKNLKNLAGQYFHKYAYIILGIEFTPTKKIHNIELTKRCEKMGKNVASIKIPSSNPDIWDITLVYHYCDR